MKTLIIDNYDSFTYNIYDLVAQVNQEDPIVLQNDELKWHELDFKDFDNIILSPGPGHPQKEKDFGICQHILLNNPLPILGICLGHQGISSVFGGQVCPAPKPIHGQVYPVYHNHAELFKNIPQTFQVVRYHSLIVDELTLPENLEIIARSSDGLIMALQHKIEPIWGVQFHPESICSEYGLQLFQNFNHLTLKNLQKNGKFPKKITSKIIPKSPLKNLHQPDYQYQITSHKIAVQLDPAQFYQKYCAAHKSAIWLDGEASMLNEPTFSIIGCMDGPRSYYLKYDVDEQSIQLISQNCVVSIQENIFDFLKRELNRYQIKPNLLPFEFQCGFVGYFGYELKQEITGVKNTHSSIHPDAQLIFLDRAMVYDHQQQICYLIAILPIATLAEHQDWFMAMEQLILSELENHSSKKSDGSNVSNILDIQLERSESQYISDIHHCLNDIRAGESYEICLTNRIRFYKTIDAFQYYLTLRKLSQAPYAAFLQFDDLSIASASIERFLKIDNQGTVETKPIKGTVRRGLNSEEEQKLLNSLQNDIKFKSENLMIVDLLRNDLNKICETGSVHVPKLMAVETYPHLHQLVTTIRGQLKTQHDALDCFMACFPGGSMTGAPKLRTLEIIDRLEHSARGVYSGAIGYLSLNGSADLNIVIRTAVITPEEITIGVGGAIIELSDPQEEYDEILLKARSLLNAFS